MLIVCEFGCSFIYLQSNFLIYVSFKTKIMAKFTDSQILKLLVRRINEHYETLPSSGTCSHDLDLYDAGRRSVLESLMSAYDFLCEYNDEL